MSQHLGTHPGSSVYYLMDMEKQSITMVELKKQVEALGLEEKQKTKCLMEEWKRLCECEEERLEAKREEKRLEVEHDEKRLEAERVHEEKRLEAKREQEEKRLEVEREREYELELRRIELEQASIEFESKKGERESRSDVAEEIRRSVRIARSPELFAFVDGKDDLDNYLLCFEIYATVGRWEKDSRATPLSPLLSGHALEVYSRLSHVDAVSYNCFKLAWLNRYDFTKFGYRKRFREAKPEGRESPVQFMVRLKDYFTKWVKLSKV